jgi:hypothetical protein
LNKISELVSVNSSEAQCYIKAACGLAQEATTMMPLYLYSCYTVLYSFKDLLKFETGSCYVAQAGHELTIILCQPPKCWD